MKEVGEIVITNCYTKMRLEIETKGIQKHDDRNRIQEFSDHKS